MTIEPYVLDYEDTGESTEHFIWVRVFCPCGFDKRCTGVYSAWGDGDMHARRHLHNNEPVTIQLYSGPVTYHSKAEYDKVIKDQ